MYGRSLEFNFKIHRYESVMICDNPFRHHDIRKVELVKLMLYFDQETKYNLTQKKHQGSNLILIRIG